MRKRPVPISESGTTGRPRISSQPSLSTSNGFIRTSAAGNGQLRLCWSIAFEIASRFFASGDAIHRQASWASRRRPAGGGPLDPAHLPFVLGTNAGDVVGVERVLLVVDD